MRNTVFVVVIVLILGQTGCKRKAQRNDAASAAAAAEAAKNTEGDRSQATIYLEQGREFYRNDEDSRAAEAFKQAVKLNPELAEAHFRLGLTFDALGQQQEAEAEYKKAVETYKKYFAGSENEKDAEAHYNLGETYAGLHLYEEAVREYRQAVRNKTDDPDIYYDLGTALMRLAQYDDAAAAFSKSLDLDPENYRAQDALAEARDGVTRIRTGKKHQEELLKKKKTEDAPEEARPASTRTPI